MGWRSLAILIIAWSIPALAANKDEDFVLLKPFMKISLLELELEPYSQPESQADESLTYEPNVNPDFGLALEIGDFEIAASLPLRMDDEELRQKGRTTSEDYNVSVLRDQWGAQLGFQRYKGFYSDLGDGLSAEVAEKDLFRNPTLTRDGYYGRVLWFPKIFAIGDLSFLASPLFGLSIDALRMTTAASLIPEDQFALYGDDVELRSSTMETYSALFGGRGKIVRGSWEGGMLLYFGRGAQYRVLRFENSDRMAGWQNAGKFGFHLESSNLDTRQAGCLLA
jgi:hypothetical protein